jgi:tRNA threonylcarbamoyladenosine biosynthesis protein TsaB
MKILGIETSGTIGGIALVSERGIIITRTFKTGMQHGKELIPAIKDTLSEIKWTLKDIGLIAVDVGPGSYTGLRIGVTCAKTLAFALNIPVADVPIFDIIAENYVLNSLTYQKARNEKEIESQWEKNITKEFFICPVFDARRKHVYACVYKCVRLYSGQNSVTIQKTKSSDFLVIRPENLVPALPRPAIIFGDGVLPYKDIFQKDDIFTDKEQKAIPKPEHVALLGEKMYLSGHRCDINKLSPLYLRKAEALEKKEGK